MARAVVRARAVMLLDEPFASLDVGWRHSLYRQLREIAHQRQLTIVLVTHDVGEVVELADRALVFAARDHAPHTVALVGAGAVQEPRAEIRRLLTEGHRSFQFHEATQ
jgi:NitT/TauT family transport system ATP-binding protein